MLIEALVAKQRERGLTDAEFASSLGASRPMWSMVRSGHKRPGRKFLQGVMRRYPDLTSECLAYLRDAAY